MAGEEKLSVSVKWSGKEYKVEDMLKLATVADLKARIFQETGVKPERQKLLGLKCKGMSISMAVPWYSWTIILW